MESWIICDTAKFFSEASMCSGWDERMRRLDLPGGQLRRERVMNVVKEDI